MLIVKLKDKEQAKRAINEGYRLILIAFYTQSDEKHYCIVSISPAYVPTNNLFNSVFYKDIVETIVHRILVSTDRLFRVNLIAKEHLGNFDWVFDTNQQRTPKDQQILDLREDEEPIEDLVLLCEKHNHGHAGRRAIILPISRKSSEAVDDELWITIAERPTSKFSELIDLANERDFVLLGSIDELVDIQQKAHFEGVHP